MPCCCRAPQVMDMWATHYGGEAGVMGLRCIPMGGLFLAGGMTPKNLRLLKVRCRAVWCEAIQLPN